MGSPPSRISDLQNTFLNTYREQIRRDLGDGVKLEYASLSEDAALGLLKSCQKNGVETPLLGYHGTDSRNLNSIYRRGPLIPDVERNGVNVVHGSAYGRGIYTSRPGYSDISKCYMGVESKTMLCCGILPNDLVGEPYKRIVKKMYSDKGIRVLFDERQVAPLVIAKFSEPKRIQSERGDDLKFVPLKGNANVNKFGNQWVGRHRKKLDSGEVIWLPPTPETWNKARRTKRRLVKRNRDLSRRCTRDQKYQANNTCLY